MGTQESFGALFTEPFASSIREGRMSVADASMKCKALRDELAREYKSEGRQIRSWTLSGQLRQYWGLGKPCGMTCTVYMLNVA